MSAYRITVSGSGEGGWSTFYYDTATALFYETNDFTQPPITSVVMHTREMYASLGYRKTNSDTGVICVNSDGTIASDFVPTGNMYVYARWSRVSYKVTLSKNRGDGDVEIYYKAGTSPNEFYADDLCTTAALESVQFTSRAGYSPTGAFSTASSSVQYISASGEILELLRSLSITSTGKTLYMQWSARTYTLTFDYHGGSGAVASKQVTFDAPIGELPGATISRGSFVGWTLNGDAITSATAWTIPDDATAVAAYDMNFGGVIDYFGLGSGALMPESSEDGANKPHIVAFNADGETPATENGGKWMNPRVTYRVVRDMTVDVTLGRGYAGITSGNSVTTSGYMITSVEIATAIGSAPAVTVTGVANEGYTQGATTKTAVATNAVSTRRIQVAVSARHRAQNLMNSIGGYGQLQSLTLVASADPIVMAERNMPCASDIVHPKVDVAAIVADYEREGEPTAGSGFTSLGAVPTTSGIGYKTWSAKLTKEI